jgi:putative thiamine transport system ATP-binding protein
MALDIHINTLQAANKPLAQGLHIHCPAGTITTLMGASGSGKSSILAAVAGTLDTALRFEGDIQLDGQSVAALPCAQRRIGVLFQDDLLFAHMSLKENLLFAVPAGPAAQRQAAVQAALQELGFADMAQRSPTTLSGGQRARVSLLRTLLAQPKALLLDEPFSKLDAALRQQFREFVFTYVRQQGLPTLLVTHDAADVADPDRIIYL